MSRGQATLRRLMSGNISDRTLTPASGGRIDPRLGSVLAPGVSPVRSIRFSELTAAETTSLPLHFSDNGEGSRTPEDWRSIEMSGRDDRVGFPVIHEDLDTRSSEQYVENVDSKEDRQQEWLEPNYPPGIFRYIPSDYQLAQEKAVRTTHMAKLASCAGLSSSISPKPPVPRGQQSDSTRIRQGYDVVLSDQSEAILTKGDSFHRDDPEAKNNVGDFSNMAVELHAGTG